MKRTQWLLILIVFGLSITACNLPDRVNSADLQDINQTQENFAPLATPTLIQIPSPTSTLYGTVSGQVCFPSSPSPEIIVYLENINTHVVYEIDVAVNENTYQAQIPPGGYIAYAWLPDFSQAGTFSEAVLCGLTASCTDHALLTFFATAGQESKNIDICDWPENIESVPTPSNKG